MYRNKALQSAHDKGRAAAMAGKPETNPYGDARTLGGQVTFARAFYRAWAAGYRSGLDAMLADATKDPAADCDGPGGDSSRVAGDEGEALDGLT